MNKFEYVTQRDTARSGRALQRDDGLDRLNQGLVSMRPHRGYLPWMRMKLQHAARVVGQHHEPPVVALPVSS